MPVDPMCSGVRVRGHHRFDSGRAHNCEHFASDSIVSSREARGSAGECGVERARSGGARDGCRWRYGEFAGGGRAVGPRQQRS